MAKAFSIEDGNLSNVPITSSVERTYSDIDCSFLPKPSGDVYKKTDAAAVKQSVKNILMTNQGEAVFRPYYGAGLNSLLFELSSDLDERDVEDRVFSALARLEPRVRTLNVGVNIQPDYNSMAVTVTFQVIQTLEEVTVNVTIGRVR